MKRPYALFDMDGTLLDSMPYWMSLDHSYLVKHGLEYTEEIQRVTEKLRLRDVLAWYHEELGLGDSPESMVIDCFAIMLRHYTQDIKVKDGVIPYLDALQAAGVKMAVVTASPMVLAVPAIERHGLEKYFAEIISIDDVGASKNEPVIYDEGLRRLGGSHREEAVVYEDATYSLRTAHQAGYFTVLVDDAFYLPSRKEALLYADHHVKFLDAAEALMIHGALD
ncbi:MAG: HAD family phosphatase [Bacillota bacterium]|nr:HAD family phosphatase [Bacillota bacterium]